jgi:hypothetical protein
MECTQQAEFRSPCEGGACVEIAVHDGHVHVRTSGDPDLVVVIPLDIWNARTADPYGAEFAEWFPTVTGWGDFALTVMQSEITAFLATLAPAA